MRRNGVHRLKFQNDCTALNAAFSLTLVFRFIFSSFICFGYLERVSAWGHSGWKGILLRPPRCCYNIESRIENRQTDLFPWIGCRTHDNNIVALHAYYSRVHVVARWNDVFSPLITYNFSFITFRSNWTKQNTILSTTKMTALSRIPASSMSQRQLNHFHISFIYPENIFWMDAV